MATATEITAMQRAIELAARGGLATWPNPNVGCVLLDAMGNTVGEGWHERPGGPHAEVVAIAAAGERARGATAVVTLEPCAHQGRTGPCAQALLGAGIARVVYAVDDPNPLAAGGAAVLQDAGVSVEGGVLAEAGERGNEVWLTAIRRRRPYVVWKYAASMDGRVAAADGTSRWISGPAARRQVHDLRAECDAVLVGVGTVLADDPQLTVRAVDGKPMEGPQPLRVVVDTSGRTPAEAKVRDGSAPTWIATADEIGRGADGHVDLTSLLRTLFERNCRQVLLEGGPTVAAAFLRAGFVDRVVAYVAPVLLGAGPLAAGDLGVGTLADAVRLELDSVEQVGGDVRIAARLRHRTGE